MIKVTIDGTEYEVEQSDLTLPDNMVMFEDGNVPKGYFTQDAMEQKIQDRLSKAKRNSETELLNDESFLKKALSKKGVTLDKDGNPKGLKPEFDVEEWKQQKAKELTDPLKQELQEYKSKVDKLKMSKVQSDILKAANGMFQEQYIKSYTGSDDPFVVKQFSDLFDVDPETGETALKDTDGTFAIDGSGKRITPDKYFESNADKFSDLLQDKRQKGSKFQKGGGSKRGVTEGDIMKMSDAEWKEKREEIIKNSSK